VELTEALSKQKNFKTMFSFPMSFAFTVRGWSCSLTRNELEF
jgi:hypothetical protein